MTGMVARLESRTIPAKGDRAEMTFKSFLLVGENCMGQIRVGDAFEMPKQGAQVSCRVKVSTYRDDDELSLDAYL